jgi:hypothetical protein
MRSTKLGSTRRSQAVRYNARSGAEGDLILAFEESLKCLPSVQPAFRCCLFTMLFTMPLSWPPLPAFQSKML